MSRLSKILKHFDEKGQQFRTKIKEIPSSQGSRHIRNQIEDAVKKTHNMLQANNGCPSPKNSDDEKLLNSVVTLMDDVISKLKSVKDSKKGVK